MTQLFPAAEVRNWFERHPALDDDQVHIYSWSTDEIPDQVTGLDWLDAHEQQTCAALATSELQQRYLAAHAGLRHVLAGYLQCQAADVQFDRTPTGKPTVADASLHFNLSHSGAEVLLGVARTEVGVDIERARSVTHRDSLVAKHFTRSERRQFEALDPSAQLCGFFELWTRKEAVLKLTGLGLQAPAVEIEVGLGNERRRKVTIPPTWSTSFRVCYVGSLETNGGCSAAIATTTAGTRHAVFRLYGT